MASSMNDYQLAPPARLPPDEAAGRRYDSYGLVWNVHKDVPLVCSYSTHHQRDLPEVRRVESCSLALATKRVVRCQNQCALLCVAPRQSH